MESKKQYKKYIKELNTSKNGLWVSFNKKRDKEDFRRTSIHETDIRRFYTGVYTVSSNVFEVISSYWEKSQISWVIRSDNSTNQVN